MPDCPAYRLTLPETLTTSVVFSSPHSGRTYPDEFLRATVLDRRMIRSSEDAFVDLLLAGVAELGAPLIAAVAPRAYVDLNRSADELDPAVIEGVAQVSHNPRVQSGLGVIPRVVSGARAIYSGKIRRAEAEARLAEFWHPYHDRLARLLEAARQSFGQVILIDMHSMPHEAMEAQAHRAGRRPEIVIGDRYGASAAAGIVDAVDAAFRGRGFRVARNTPFAGAYIAQTYGRPSIGQHVIQIEIDRALYLDEQAIRPAPQFDAFMARLAPALAEIADLGRVAGQDKLAAE